MTDTETAPVTNTEHRHAARFSTHKALAFVQILRHDSPDDVVIQGVTDNLKTVLSTIRGRYGLTPEQQKERLETATATLTDSSIALHDLGLTALSDLERVTLLGYAMNAIATAVGHLEHAVSNVVTPVEDPDSDGGMA